MRPIASRRRLRVGIVATLATLVVAAAACRREIPVDSVPPAPQLMEPMVDDYPAAPADSCQRGQVRAERAPVFRVMREEVPYRTNEKPPYPLRERQGPYQQVTVQFHVTPRGRVDMANVRFVSSSGQRSRRRCARCCRRGASGPPSSCRGVACGSA